MRLSHYMGVWRGVLAAGEAICFGIDAAKISYRVFASGILAFYCVGALALFYLILIEVEETCYYKENEEGVVVPGYVKDKEKVVNDFPPKTIVKIGYVSKL